MEWVPDKFILTLVLQIFFFLSIAPTLADSATTLDVSAPASVEIYDHFTVTADYESNGTNICGAFCDISSGWPGGSITLFEQSGCIYSSSVYASNWLDYHTVTVTCSKSGFETRSEQFDIKVEKKEAILSFSIHPDKPPIGETVNIEASYVDENRNPITGGDCNAVLRKGTTIRQTSLGLVNLVYTGSLTIPIEPGEYSITVTCTSSEYETESSGKYFTASKKTSVLSVEIVPGAPHYGEDIDVEADYTHYGDQILGTCAMTLDDVEKRMSYHPTGYEGKVKIPYKKGTYNLKVRCSSNLYETVERTETISPLERPTDLGVISPVEEIWVFYPNEEIKPRISYTDSLTKESITGADCFAQIGDKSYSLEGTGEYYEGVIENQTLGTYSLSIMCSKELYQARTKNVRMNIIRIPIHINLLGAKSEYRSGEEIKIKAMVIDRYGENASVSCKARIDTYDLSFNNLLGYDVVDMKREGELHVLTIPNTGQPSRIRVTITCSGDIYEEKSSWLEMKIKLLGKGTEEGVLLFLTVTSLILIGLLFLIRRKLKLI